jgi:hypothetical protein
MKSSEGLLHRRYVPPRNDEEWTLRGILYICTVVWDKNLV